MKIAVCLIMIILCVCFVGCRNNSDAEIIGGADGPTSIVVTDDGEKTMYKQITQEEAKNIMESGESYVLLDTREQYEYDEGHIPGAVLIPYTEIDAKAESVIADKDALILVYCRSGRRSKIAAVSLAGLGYTDVKEFGGIIDWKWDIEK